MANLDKIQVDGVDLDLSNYDVDSGSKILTLHSSYLDTLAEGNHTVTFVYGDGSVSTNLAIVGAGGGNNGGNGGGTSGNGNESESGKAGEAGANDATASGKSPATGDSNAMALLFGAVALSGAGMFATMKKRKAVK